MVTLRLNGLSLAVAILLGISACTDRAVGPDTADALVAADAAVAVCPSSACSGHGHCPGAATAAACVCDSGYVPAAGWACVPDWPCAAGLVRVDDVCVPVAVLAHWCDDACASRDLACASAMASSAACAPYCASGLAAGAGCIADCMATMDEPGQAQATVCRGLMHRMDSIDCTQLAHCDQPVAPTTCEALCDAAQDCGLLTDARLLLGGSHGACMLSCRALASALTPSLRFEPMRQCLVDAMATCDPLRVLSCTVVGVAELDTTLCTSAATTCGFIPGVWPDAAACASSLAGWSAGQRMAVGGCLQIGGNDALCAEHQCANPPAALPSGALAAAEQLMAHCPQLLAVPADYPPAAQYYAWLFMAILKAFGEPLERDYGLVTDCFVSAPCPTTRDETLKCLLAPTKD